jgi:hypothetical protein
MDELLERRESANSQIRIPDRRRGAPVKHRCSTTLLEFMLHDS